MNAYVAVAAAALIGLWATNAKAAEAAAGPDSFWSRVTIEIPAYTHHIPQDRYFNDQNWGAFVEVAVNDQFSVVAGDFNNSYWRNTAFAAVSWEPVSVRVLGVRLRFGGIAGLDLNGGYRGFNDVEPLLGALNVRLVSANPVSSSPLDRTGLLLTVIPGAPQGGSTAINLAVTYRLR